MKPDLKLYVQSDWNEVLAASGGNESHVWLIIHKKEIEINARVLSKPSHAPAGGELPQLQVEFTPNAEDASLSQQGWEATYLTRRCLKVACDQIQYAVG